MKKRFLTYVNILLGAMTLGLIGCHSSKQALVKYGVPPEPEKYGPPAEMIAMYGVPVVTQEEQPRDTVAPIEELDRPMLKYGVPPSLRNR